MSEQKFQIGDKVVLKDYEFVCKNRHINPENETFKRHYNYVKSKEPLELFWVYAPGELTYSITDCDNVSLKGQPVNTYMYNFHTPRSKMYLYEECELELYVEPETEEE